MRKSPLALAITFSIALIGCGDQKQVPFLGQWVGQFDVEKVKQGPDSATDRRQHSLRGYLSVRLNKNIYLMHLEGEQQQVDITGKWSYKGNQLTLNPDKIDVKSDGGAAGPNPNLKYVPDADLHEAYMQKITLNLSADHSTLKGLATTIAFLEGTHNFKKE